MIRSISKIILAVTLIAQTNTCKKDNAKINAPDCVLAKIESIKKEDVWNPPAKVYEYEYKGQKVYYIPSRCCDIPSILYNSNCQAICSPDGGFTGKGDGKCSDFFETRKNERLVWQDERKYQ